MNNPPIFYSHISPSAHSRNILMFYQKYWWYLKWHAWRRQVFKLCGTRGSGVTLIIWNAKAALKKKKIQWAPAFTVSRRSHGACQRKWYLINMVSVECLSNLLRFFKIQNVLYNNWWKITCRDLATLKQIAAFKPFLRVSGRRHCYYVYFKSLHFYIIEEKFNIIPPFSFPLPTHPTTPQVWLGSRHEYLIA